MTLTLQERAINLIAEGTEVEGKLVIDQTARIHGRVKGELAGKRGSQIILMAGALIEGKIDADELIVNGFVQGEIRAKTRVVVSASGKVIGNIQSPSIRIEFGAHVEGRCTMEGETWGPETGPTAAAAPSLA